MIQNRELVEKKLNSVFDKIAVNEELKNEFIQQIISKHNLNEIKVLDGINGTISLSEYNEVELYILYEAAFQMNLVKIPANTYYTEIEISNYKNYVEEQEGSIFPLVFQMLPVRREGREVDQWIGTTDIHTLLEMNKSQLIKYNANAQRIMRSKIKKDQRILRVNLNKKAVSKIMDLFKRNEFIPNTITLNIPSDADVDFSYNEKTKELTFKHISSFDISDGYHRFIAACKVSYENPSFNYPVELRILHYSQDDIKRFIYQEDQKTKMRHIDSEAMNVDKTSNRITEKINRNSICNLYNCIKNSSNDNDNGIWGFSEVSELIHDLYIKGNKKIKDAGQLNLFIVSTANEIVSKLNLLSDKYPEEILRPLSTKKLIIIFYGIKNYDGEEMVEKIHNALNNPATKDLNLSLPLLGNKLIKISKIFE